VALLRFENAVHVVFAVMVLPGRRDPDPIDVENKSPEASRGFQTSIFLHLRGKMRNCNAAPRERSFSVGYLTKQDNLVLLSITVIVDIKSAANARLFVRNIIDAHVRTAPDCR
jgi:hypothetical protein